MGNRVQWSADLAAKVVALYRQRVCVRLIVELTRCSVAQAKRAIRESPTASDDHAVRIRAVVLRRKLS
jgi:hypothetical protein